MESGLFGGPGQERQMWKGGRRKGRGETQRNDRMRRSLGCLLGVEAWKQPCHGLPSADSAQCPSNRPAPSLSSLLSAETEGDHAWLPRDSGQERNARSLRDRPKHSGWKEDISTFISPFTLWGDARVAGQSCPSLCSTRHCCWVCIKWSDAVIRLQGFNDQIIRRRSGDVGITNNALSLSQTVLKQDRGSTSNIWTLISFVDSHIHMHFC